MKNTLVITVLSAAILSCFNLSAQACTGVLVGKQASVDGSIIIARNEDFGVNNWNKHLAYRPAQKNQAGDWQLGNGLIVPMPPLFYAYSAIPDWDAATMNPDGRYYEERGINEYNVAISATTSAEVNEKAQAADPLIKKGVIEANIPTLILPQVKTAKQGVELLGQYIEKYGAGEGNSLYLADINEAWLFEVGSGHQWIAVKVPDDSYAMMANSLRIHGVDLNSPDVLHSQKLLEFVTQYQLLKNPNPKSFNFAKAFGVIGDVYNIDREWLGQEMLTPSLKQKTRQQQYPLFLKPDQKITIALIDKVLSSTYVGTELEQKGERPIRVDRQLESHIIALRPNMPKPFQGLIWQSYGVLAESVLVPLYSSLHSYPQPYTIGTDTYSDDSAYWQFRSLTALASINTNKYLPALHQLWQDKETKLYKQVSALDNVLQQTYKIDQQEALHMASDYSYSQLQQTYSMAKNMRYKMMTDLTKSTEKKYSEKEFKKILSL